MGQQGQGEQAAWPPSLSYHLLPCLPPFSIAFLADLDTGWAPEPLLPLSQEASSRQIPRSLPHSLSTSLSPLLAWNRLCRAGLLAVWGRNSSEALLYLLQPSQTPARSGEMLLFREPSWLEISAVVQIPPSMPGLLIVKQRRGAGLGAEAENRNLCAADAVPASAGLPAQDFSQLSAVILGPRWNFLFSMMNGGKNLFLESSKYGNLSTSPS